MSDTPIDQFSLSYKIIEAFVIGGFFMTKKQTNTKNKSVGITVRVDAEKNRILSAILSLKGMTLSSFLQDSINTFIKENYEEAKELFDISRIAGMSGEDDKQK